MVELNDSAVKYAFRFRVFLQYIRLSKMSFQLRVSADVLTGVILYGSSRWTLFKTDDDLNE